MASKKKKKKNSNNKDSIYEYYIKKFKGNIRRFKFNYFQMGEFRRISLLNSLGNIDEIFLNVEDYFFPIISSILENIEITENGIEIHETIKAKNLKDKKQIHIGEHFQCT